VRPEKWLPTQGDTEPALWSPDRSDDDSFEERRISGKVVVGPPKTSAGRPTIAVPSNIVPAVKDHLERFVGPDPEDWLFTSEAGGPMLPNATEDRDRAIAAALADLGAASVAPLRTTPDRKARTRRLKA
jgi:hypothetical protein